MTDEQGGKDNGQEEGDRRHRSPAERERRAHQWNMLTDEGV